MKVLFLTNIPAPYRVDFFQELGRYCDLTVLYELTSATDRDKDWKRKIENPNYKSIYLKAVLKQRSSAWCPSVTKYLKKGLYDVIIIGVYSTPTGMSAIQYLNRKKLPYLINCDGGFIPVRENPLKYKLKKYLLSGAAGWLSSGRLADVYLLHYGATKERIYQYPFTSLKMTDICSVCLTAEEKQRQKQELNITDKKMVLAVGQFVPRKGFDVLIEAAAHISRECSIYFVGGQAPDEYIQLAEKFQLKNIHFLPFINSKQLQKYYQAADVFVLPTREDIWGLVINEAMAAGLPVVTTDMCAAGVELLEQEYIVPVGDAIAMGTVVNRLLKDDELRERTGNRNLEKIREYTIENMARVHADIISLCKR